MTPTRMAKAARMVMEGRVTRLSSAQAYNVEGETGTYVVVLFGGGESFCSCPYDGDDDCSHVLAASYERKYG